MHEASPRKPVQILLVGIVLLYAAFLLAAPLIAIAQKALAGGVQPAIATLSDPTVLHALQLTLTVTLGAVLFNTLCGVVVAWVLSRQSFLGRSILNVLVDIPFVFSPVIAGYTLITLFGRNGWLAPTPIPIAFAVPGIFLATIFVSLPFVTREVGPVLGTVDREPEYAAYTIGASPWLTFRRIILPNIWPGIVYGVVLTFARAIGEFGAVAVVGGGVEGQTETATMYVSRALNDRNNVGAYGMSLALGLIAIMILLVMRLLQRSLVREQAVHVNHTG